MDTSFIGSEDFANLVSSATGENTSGEKLLVLGGKVCNIEKAFNTLHAEFQRKR